MKELLGKVAVITGAASGFGREFAIRCADEGMKVILTDIDTGGLGTTVALLKPGTESLVIGSDVSSADSIEDLARSTYDRFGACHLLFNNAGVGTAGPIWTATLDDWKWTLGINVMGVVHGLRSFVPRMLAQKEESYIVNTASAAGLLAPPGSGVYAASKHAVVAITEENNRLFPHRPVDERGVAISTGLMNMFSGSVGGVPLCHGAGGMAGHVRFGAHTGGAVVILGASGKYSLSNL